MVSLRPVAAIITLLKETKRFMLGKLTPMWTPYQAQVLVSSKGTGWLSPRRLLQLRLCFFEKNLFLINLFAGQQWRQRHREKT